MFRLLSFTLEFNEGDEIIVSAIDHEANIASWVDLAARQKLVLKWWLPNAAAPDAKTNPKLLAEDLAALLSPKTRLVSFTHTSNILGSIHDVKTLAKLAHDNNPKTLVVVDAVAYAPHRKVDVKDLGVDFYSFSWYKVGPPGSPCAYSHQGQGLICHRSMVLTWLFSTGAPRPSPRCARSVTSSTPTGPWRIRSAWRVPATSWYTRSLRFSTT